MSHHHSHIRKNQVKATNLVNSILLNLLITIAQVVGGIMSGSLALISDALHNFSDVLSLVFSLVAHKLSKKKASEANTFGYKRAEILAAFVNASTLIIVAFILIYGAINRFFHPEAIQSTIVIWLAVLGILANGISVFLLKNDADHNLNMKSAYLHLLTDMMASVAVLVGGLLMKFYNWFWVDSIMTILIAVYLIIVGFDLVKKSTKILMLFTPEAINIKDIISEVKAIDGVVHLHHIHVWNLNDEEIHLEAHLNCKEEVKLNQIAEILDTIETVLHEKFGITHITIQPDFKKGETEEVIIDD